MAKPSVKKAAPKAALSDAYKAGYEANAADENVDACPHKAGTIEAADWKSGWYAADAKRHDARSSRKVRR